MARLVLSCLGDKQAGTRLKQDCLAHLQTSATQKQESRTIQHECLTDKHGCRDNLLKKGFYEVKSRRNKINASLLNLIMEGNLTAMSAMFFAKS